VKRHCLPPGGVCTGCAAYVFAGIWHKCGEPYRWGGPEGEIVEVTATSAVTGPAQNTATSPDPGAITVVGQLLDGGPGESPGPVERLTRKNAEAERLALAQALRVKGGNNRGKINAERDLRIRDAKAAARQRSRSPTMKGCQPPASAASLTDALKLFRAC
jgi:hypothetical protein